MKFLVLSCNTGAGHNSAAKAVQEAFLLQNDECIFKDALSFGHQKISDFVCDAYVEMVKKAPELFGKIYEMGSNMWKYNPNNQKIKSPVYLMNETYSKALGKYIEKEKFDAVICSHFFPAQALTHLKRHNRLNVPVYYISTDYSCIPLLEETEIDYVFSPHPDTISTFTVRGIPESKVIHSGIPVAQKFTTKLSKTEARKQLKIQESEKVILMMSGSMGFGDTLETAEKIFNQANENTRLIVITGNNKKMYDSFKKYFRGNKQLTLIGFTDQVSLYMDASDILLSKPGGLSSTEALVKCIPLIHTSPIPGCESENAEFFQQHHISMIAETSDDAAKLAIKLLNDDFLRNQISEAQKHYKYENSAMFVTKWIKNDLEKKN